MAQVSYNEFENAYQLVLKGDINQGALLMKNYSGEKGDSASSLFMKYVKQKLVKKIKTD